MNARSADLTVAAVVFLVTLLSAAAPHHLRDWVAVGLATVASGALVVRRRWPYAVLIVSTAAAEVFLARYQGVNRTLVLAAPLVALYSVAESTDRRRSLVIGGLVVLAIGGFHTALGKPARFLGPENIALAALGGLAVAAGDAARSRRAYLAEVEARAQRAEHDREAEARRRVTEERLRIARDLHDSVGHHLALINVQAGVATHVLGDRGGPSPAAVRDTFAQIRQGSRAALDELRDTVGLLRQPGDPAAPVEPTVGLSSLPDLLAVYARSGLDVAVEESGPAVTLPWATDVAAYRVIQESLTNARKHAGPAPVALTLAYAGDALTITLVNVASVAGPDGHGITGMRERVTAIGGTFSSGLAGGVFTVRAVLPL
jgi:signal transduction histidine kinase